MTVVIVLTVVKVVKGSDTRDSSDSSYSSNSSDRCDRSDSCDKKKVHQIIGRGKVLFNFLSLCKSLNFSETKTYSLVSIKMKDICKKTIWENLYKYGLHQYLRKAQQDLHSLVTKLKNMIQTKLKNLISVKTQKEAKFKSNSDQTQKLKLWQNQKLNFRSCDQTQHF